MSAIAKLSATRTAKLVDRAGELSSQIANLKEELDQLKASFKEQGEGTYTGKYYKLTVSKYESSKLNIAQAKSFLTPSQIIQCTETTESVTVRLNAR